MARRILMTGSDAKYISMHKKGDQPQDRDILMTGDNAQYVEIIVDEQQNKLK